MSQILIFYVLSSIVISFIISQIMASIIISLLKKRQEDNTCMTEDQFKSFQNIILCCFFPILGIIFSSFTYYYCINTKICRFVYSIC